MHTGEKLRLLRTIKGLKQQYIANQLGITQQAYSKLERKNSINGQLMERIMQCMNCTPKDMELIKNISVYPDNPED